MSRKKYSINHLLPPFEHKQKYCIDIERIYILVECLFISLFVVMSSYQCCIIILQTHTFFNSTPVYVSNYYDYCLLLFNYFVFANELILFNGASLQTFNTRLYLYSRYGN